MNYNEKLKVIYEFLQGEIEKNKQTFITEQYITEQRQVLKQKLHILNEKVGERIQNIGKA
tara:strand:- start:6031 stop:6210 length:180 start_codon:yes stop_codon:yes gene_type:complete